MRVLTAIFISQLQLWLENPLQQVTLKNALPQIEAPYNSKDNFTTTQEFTNFNNYKLQKVE